MLVRVLYAAVMLSLLGSFPRKAADRAVDAARRSEHGAEALAPATSPAWAPRPLPERYCVNEGALDIGRAADFAVPRIDR
jgi:hypothetical protein